MPVIQRLVFYLYTLFFTFLSLGAALFGWGLISADFLWTNFAESVTGEDILKLGLSGTVVFAAGVWVLLAGFFAGEEKKSIAQYNLMGNVYIYAYAIEEFIERTAKNTDGVKEAQASVSSGHQKESGMTAVIKITVSQDADIAKVSSEVQGHIQEAVKNTIGAEILEIKIIVEKISGEFKVKNRLK